MASFINLFISFLSLLAAAVPACCYINPGARISQDGGVARPVSEYRTYVVLVNPSPHGAGFGAGDEGRRRWHESFLPSSTEPRLVHSYSEVFDGFAARLTDAELHEVVSRRPGFVRAFPGRRWNLTTTHTPAFLGLTHGAGLWRDADYGKGVIVGLVDTGLHSAHPSFDDDGIPPPQARWKGSCEGSASRCNNKFIGGKFFVEDDFEDLYGHGTHTASTAAGNFVVGASAAGGGGGTAAGIAPGAPIAMYKVCTLYVDCEDTTILAGIDAAMKDGVDVLSISMGSDEGKPISEDPVIIGAFRAVSRGITVVCSAGNAGPSPSTVTNNAPTSRKEAPANGSMMHDLFAIEGIKQQGGAVGVVLINGERDGYTTNLWSVYGPGVVQMTVADGREIASYVAAAGESTASVAPIDTVLGVRPAPTVASFSSRGPSKACPGVLKPDILAPGLHILGAWLPDSVMGPWPFNVMPGTSMAAPHVGGVAALVKSRHPDWSPAAIKSAILTTSNATDVTTGGPILDEQRRRATVFMTGAGHVNPTKAADPGLVYDLGVAYYAGYICTLLGDHGLALIVRNSSLTCAKLPRIVEAQLNYPTIMVPLQQAPFMVNRTVTNVGPPASTYTLKLEIPESVTVHVSPETLVFSEAGEKKTFTVTVSGGGGEQKVVEGSLSWVSEKHVVRSPVVAIVGLGDSHVSSASVVPML
uniref:Subtilisin-like protease n=1 Tax=Oryza brachyantha TaxID=4533 RepID=J3ME65_ORYBR